MTTQPVTITRQTVLKYLRAGRFKGAKVGKFWRIEERDLLAFIRGARARRRTTRLATRTPEPRKS